MVINLRSDLFKELHRISFWVKRANSDSSLAIDMLRNLDKIALDAEVNVENSKMLLGKIKNIFGKQCRLRQNQSNIDCDDRENINKLFSFFAELKAYEEMFLAGYNNIMFLPEIDDLKSPDLKTKLNNIEFYVEVKQIRRPFKEDKSLYEKKVYVSNVNKDFRDGIKKKIDDFVEDAVSKFNAHNISDRNSRILIIDYEPGIDAMLSLPSDSRTLEHMFDLDFWKKLEDANNISIWKRKYFIN